MYKNFITQIKSYRSLKRYQKGVELTWYTKSIETRQSTSIYKIDLNKIIWDEIKQKEKIKIIQHIQGF